MCNDLETRLTRILITTIRCEIYCMNRKEWEPSQQYRFETCGSNLIFVRSMVLFSKQQLQDVDVSQKFSETDVMCM